jgi:hypothetical protein
MPKYYSLMLSPNISKTVQGYLICENVPLCRSGFQEYYGRELVGFPGYEDSWNLEPNTKYKIYRPKESVLDPEFIKSLEGITVVDEHPDGSVVHLDNDKELNCGHLEKVCKGDEIDGEVTLKGDLHIKDPDLIEKIRPEADPNADYAVRDVSLGYSMKLKKLDDGTIIVYRLRGNHVAVVEKGRAGPVIAIGDSAPTESPKVEFEVKPEPEIKKKKEINMSWKDKIFGDWLKTSDATPEERAEAFKELHALKPITDAEPDKEEKKDEDPHKEHISMVKDYCDKGGDKDALASFLKGETKPVTDADEKLEDLEEEKPEDKKEKKDDEEPEDEKPAGVEKQDEKTQAEEGDKMSTDADEIDDVGESVLKQANDSVRDYLKKTKPLVAALVCKPKSKRTVLEQTMIDSYNGAVKNLNLAGGRAYSKLSKTKIPEHIPLVITDSKQEDPCTCFEGVPYQVGLKKHQTAHTTNKETK